MHSRGVFNRTAPLEAAYVKLADRVRTAYRLQPSLSLTIWQVSDWLDLDDQVSQRVLVALAAEGVLERGSDDRYRLLLQH